MNGHESTLLCYLAQIRSKPKAVKDAIEKMSMPNGGAFSDSSVNIKEVGHCILGVTGNYSKAQIELAKYFTDWADQRHQEHESARVKRIKKAEEELEAAKRAL